MRRLVRGFVSVSANSVRSVRDVTPRPSSEVLRDVTTKDIESLTRVWKLTRYMKWPPQHPLWKDTAWAGHCRPFLLIPVANAVVGGDPIVVPFMFDSGAPDTTIQRETAVALGFTNLPPESEWKRPDQGAGSDLIKNWTENISLAGKIYEVSLGRGLFSNVDLLGADMAGRLQLSFTLTYRNNTYNDHQNNEFRVNPIIEVPKNVWVLQLDDMSPVGSAFKVSPTTNDIDSLKDAIKVKVGSDYTRNPALLTIYTKGTDGTWTPVADPKQPLTRGMDYGFSFPSRKEQ